PTNRPTAWRGCRWYWRTTSPRRRCRTVLGCWPVNSSGTTSTPGKSSWRTGRPLGRRLRNRRRRDTDDALHRLTQSRFRPVRVRRCAPCRFTALCGGHCAPEAGGAVLELEGRSADATSPTSPMHASTIIAAAYERSGVARPTTRTVPATAVPRDEPRLDTQRDRPEISPCCSS